jgi:molybdenum cofactor cytidylyltransferase
MSSQARLRGTLWSVVLAAGGSSRLGRPKQLVRLRGKPLLLNACEAARSITPGRIVVVLGADGLRLRYLLRQRSLHSLVVRNCRWREGMSSSLQRGLRQLPATCRAAMIVLCDQPWVGAPQLHSLQRAWRAKPSRAAAASYGGKSGVPAILPRRLWPRAGAGLADAGARAVLRQSGHVVQIAMPEAGFDIDTPADVARLGAVAANPRRRFRRRQA